jgi:hypothetical protein
MAEELAKRVIFSPIMSQQLMQKNVDNITSRFKSATKEQRQEGVDWYKKANDIAFELGKGDVKKGAGILSALSPAMEWHRNIRSARELVKTGETTHQYYSSTVVKAKRILEGEDPDTLFNEKTGAKTLNFYHNIANPEDPHPVTIDRHAHDIAVGEKGSMTKTLSGHLAGPRYRHFSEAYRNAAHELGIPIANQVQAVTWGTQPKGRQANG